MFFGKRFSGHHSGSISGLDILVLSIIKNHDGISGYEIIQIINEKFTNIWKASPGTIYPLLNRLAEKSFVIIEKISRNNRNLKIYRITVTGKERLKVVLKDNFELSLNTLGDYIRTIVQTWIPNEESVKNVMSCFPYHRGPPRRDIDDNDYSLNNIHRVERALHDLKFNKQRLESRLEDINKRISKYDLVLEKLRKGREENMRTIEIIEDDEEFDNF